MASSSLVRCGSLSASGELLPSFACGGGNSLARPTLLPRAASRHGGASGSGMRSTLRVRAEQLPGGGSPTPPTRVSRFLERYDPVATGVGALAVTGWCALHGQPVAEALNIAAAATVLGMVAQEVLFNGGNGAGAAGAAGAASTKEGEEDEPRV